MTTIIHKSLKRIDKRTVKVLFVIISCALMINGCRKDSVLPDEGDMSIEGTTPYDLDLPSFMPPMPIPDDNPLTEEGVELGRHLFYEPLLSKDNTQSCASCHRQDYGFVDANNRFSKGVDGFDGFRNSMPLLNLGWSDRLFWDGKARSLEELISIPVLAEFEMHETFEVAIPELENEDKYRKMFAAAFGDDDITEERIQKAVAQFLRSMVGYSLKLAPQNIGRQYRTNQEELGLRVFLDETKGDCFHCHTFTLFNTNYEFMNNGLNADPESDPGLYAHTGDPNDIGKFKVPSLYNLNFTAPYMHDGRFNTLEEVLDFYDTGFHVTPTTDVGVAKHADSNGKPVPRTWTEQEKEYLLIFLRSLEVPSLLSDTAFSNPNR